MSVEIDLMKKHDLGEYSNAHEDKFIHNLADLLTDYKNWARELRIDCSHVEFRVVTKEL